MVAEAVSDLSTRPFHRFKATGCRLVVPCCSSSVAFVPTFTAPVPMALVWLPKMARPCPTHSPPLKVLAFVSTTTVLSLMVSAPAPDTTPFKVAVFAVLP